MDNIFNIQCTEEILNRIDKLNKNSQPKWGAMDVAQMLSHCSAFQDIAMGYSTPTRSWLGFVVGKVAKPIFYNNKPLPKNMSTIPTILIVDPKEFENEKNKLKQKIKVFQMNGPESCTTHPHPFFGRLTAEEWGKGIFKHLDHHLQQFGV